jgi:hypothetical protein
VASERIRELFRRYASPLCVVFGLVVGLVYAALVYSPTSNYEARLIVSALFISGGVMGLAYFENVAMGTREVPFFVEQMRFFFGMWLLLGIVYGALTIFDLYIPSNASFSEALLSFLIGMIVGTVWMMALILLLGIRTNVASWNVIRFPVWIGAFVQWLWKTILRR